ncbi:Histidine kinase [Ulvibacter litoralis]|uniref:Histidine kinase n=1 Tax=Ulvibacter litoralis TaxID=227084 RepID=A0A1G7CLZ6_9FLAO|nr:Histidine kinase [Ulvibacter litoralis]
MSSFFTRNKQIIIHILCWSVLLFVTSFQMYSERGSVPLFYWVRLGVDVLFFYINFLILVPKLLLQKKTALYLVSIGLILIISYVFFQYYREVFEPFEQHLKPFNGDRKPPRFSSWRGIPVALNVSFILIGTIIRMYMEWNKNETRKKEIESVRTTTQLQFLKNQINPHFLFNSLNTIYSLTTKKASNAPEAVITLSELMRYMLYRANNEYVPLQEELDYISNYIKLQRLRLAYAENVTINIRGNVGAQKVRPLLLISFIENAFKYGTDYQGNTEIKIVITVSENNLSFTCVNLIGNRKADTENSGIGLVNTRERLEMLYPGMHTLEVSEKEGKYIVDLNLTLQ